MFDTIIKGGTVVTATDIFRAYIGILDGRIPMLAGDLDDGREIIDATGLLVMPGGIDSHAHLEQPGSPGIVMADTFEAGTRSAAVGGNTTVLPFCLQQKGQTLREAIKDYTDTPKAIAMSPSIGSSPIRRRRCLARSCRR